MNIIAKRQLWYKISASVIGLSILAVAVFGLRLGIDFTGGTIIEVEGSANKAEIEAAALSVDINNPSITSSGDQRLLIRYQASGNSQDQQQQFESNLKAQGLSVIRTDQIGPSVSRDLVKNAFLSLGVMSLAVIAYITYSFRKIPKNVSALNFGLATVVAAFLHDALFVLGAFAIMGQFLAVEVDSFIITALLTVIGFSIHDTIVVFDRIREKLQTSSSDFADIAEQSVQEVLVRSLNTSLVIIMVLLALFLFGGISTRYFVLALLLGMVSGTYSSIFIAAPLVVSWHKSAQKRQAKPAKKTTK